MAFENPHQFQIVNEDYYDADVILATNVLVNCLLEIKTPSGNISNIKYIYHQILYRILSVSHRISPFSIKKLPQLWRKS